MVTKKIAYNPISALKIRATLINFDQKIKKKIQSY